MNLTDIIRAAVDRLPIGSHDTGLRSVVTHIDRAIINLERGQEDGDDEWYRDAIYRCNQAFEGSIKEAYRVLADGDPAKKTPFEIEQYLENENVLRDRVLKQLIRFRKEWRNPATHDYNLDFDENEAFLAVVNVCAFAKVLINEIALRLAYNFTSPCAVSSAPNIAFSSFGEEVAESISTAFLAISSNSIQGQSLAEVQWLGSLAGFLDTFEGTETQLEATIPNASGARADMIVRRRNASVVVELKRDRRKVDAVDYAKRQLVSYLESLSIGEGVLALFSENAASYAVTCEDVDGHRIHVVKPERDSSETCD